MASKEAQDLTNVGMSLAIGAGLGMIAGEIVGGFLFGGSIDYEPYTDGKYHLFGRKIKLITPYWEIK